MSALITSRSRAVQALADRLARLATTDLPLVLEGETGTGKTRLARRIHAASRPGQPLVTADCAGLPPSLIASELFGHRPGAFTDATRARRGLLERAGAGTLILDRLDALPPEGQVALLRALEERRFTPVGAAAARRFEARVVATADAGLPGLVDTGTVRRDLYHRLAGHHVLLPPLRERTEDVLPAARAALRREARRRGTGLVLGDACAATLALYPWPGNFRELEAAMARAAVTVAGRTVEIEDLGLPAGAWPAMVQRAAEGDLALADVERLYSLWVVAAEGGNLSRAARRLGVSRRTLIRWRHAGPEPGGGR